MAQDEVLERVEESLAGLPIWRSEYRPREPVGLEAVTALAREVYAGTDPLASSTARGRFRIRRTEAGAVLGLALPLVSRAEVDLARNGDDLVVTVGMVSSAADAAIRSGTLPASPGPGWSRGNCRCGSSRTPWTRPGGGVERSADHRTTSGRSRRRLPSSSAR